MGKLVVAAHGIGNHPPDFATAWEAVLRRNHPQGEFAVVGLWWQDVLEKVAEKYPLVEQQFAAAMAQFGFPELQKILDSAGYAMAREYFMDVLVYIAMGDMTHYIQTEVALRLKQLIAAAGVRPADTILVGHSLGAAALPHVAWEERDHIGYIPYGGMLLLASPLGIVSPLPGVIRDLLGWMAGDTGMSRNEMLAAFAREWEPGTLRFLINTNDIVCADVKLLGTGVAQDPIPLRQGFNQAERTTLAVENPGSVALFSAGFPDPLTVVSNHDVSLYLERPEFRSAFDHLLGVAP
jgi:pimeloyl-ACP methyl ester carboxylesterase